jgi:hypothetical protein
MRGVEASGWEALDLPNEGWARSVCADATLVGGDFLRGGQIVYSNAGVLWEQGVGTAEYEHISTNRTDLAPDGDVMFATRGFMYGSRVARVERDDSVIDRPLEA